MSFLLDPPLLMAAGAAIERTVPARRRDLAAAAVTGVFVGGSVALYLEVPGLGFIWRWFRAETSRDFMINSGVFRRPHRNLKWPTHAAAAAMFATYPVWMAIGRHVGRRSKPETRSSLTEGTEPPRD